MVNLDAETFRELVIEALAGIPPNLADQISNVAIVITDRHPREPEPRVRYYRLHQAFPKLSLAVLEAVARGFEDEQ